MIKSKTEPLQIKINDELRGKLLSCKDLLKCIAILEPKIKEDSKLDFVKICIFDNSKTMECIAKSTPFEPKIVPNPKHYSFNCMLYKLKELSTGIINNKYLGKNNFSCMLVSDFGIDVAFSEIFTYKRIGIIIGFNFDKRKISQEQLNVLNEYGKKYSNVLNIFRRLDERDSKIEYLTFLEDINKNIPESAKFSATMKKILFMISKTFNFDICAFVQHEKGMLPKKLKDAVKSHYCKEHDCLEVAKKAIHFQYPIIEKINCHRLKNEVFGSSFSFIGEKKTPLVKYFDEFVIVPLNGLDENKISFILCLNRLDKKTLNKKTISELTVFQTQILSTLRNVTLVNDIKEDYKEIRELHNLSYRLNLVTREDKIIQNSFDEVMSFFGAKVGAVYVVNDSLPELLFSKNIDQTNEAAYKKIVQLMSGPPLPNKTILSSFDMPDFVNYGILELPNNAVENKSDFVEYGKEPKLISQILIFVPLYKQKEYLFLLQSTEDYLRKRKNKILSEIIGSTITRILENSRMHQEIINYNEILLADKKMLSDAITEDREKLFNIVNGMDEPLIAFNSDWIIEIFNDAAESMFGIDKENIVKTDAKAFIKHWRLPINLGDHIFKKRIIEYAINDKFYKIIKTPYNAKSGRRGTVLVFENVTKEREVEEMKNEFISLLSHEMKTPLTSITGFSKLLLTGKLGEVSAQQKDCVDVIHDEGERLKNLVEEILDIDRLEKGKLTLNKTPVNLISVFSDTLDNKIMLKNRSVKIIKDFPQKVPTIMADEDKIRQILINLVSNAIKFTDDGGSITVKMTSNDKEIITSVTDTGVGMKQEDLRYIFEKFYQVQSHLTRSQGGVGLGLSIVKKILDLHSGHIDVKSKLGKGSTFTFYLPIKG